MRFVVGREALGDAVAFVARALSSRPVVPLLSGMLLDAGSDGLTLSCFDYEVSARATVEAQIIEPGTALVPGRLLAEITRSLPAHPAEFSDDGEVVNLSCGRAEFGLVCLPVQDYPALPQPPSPVGTVDGGALASAVGQVAPAASRDDTLPMLTAICLDIAGQVMTLAATDRYRLAASEVPFAPAEPDVRAIALVPARTMVEAGRMLEAGAPVTISFGTEGTGRVSRDELAGRTGRAEPDYQPRPAEGLISLDAGDRRLTARLIGGEFIKYRSRFPDEFGSRADLPAGPVIAAVRRAALVAERAGPVQLSFRPDQVTIEAHAEGRARAAETVGAEFTGEQSVMTFNPHYLLDGLTAAVATGVAAAAKVGPAGKAGPVGKPGQAKSVPAKAGAVPKAGADPAGLAKAGADKAGPGKTSPVRTGTGKSATLKSEAAIAAGVPGKSRATARAAAAAEADATAEPRVGESGVGESAVGESGVGEVGADEAGAAEPGANGPGANGTAANGPGANQPDVAVPGAVAEDDAEIAGVGGPAEGGRIRLEFNTAAKPALITWAGFDDEDPGQDGDGTRAPAFRYLLVPLRVPPRG